MSFGNPTKIRLGMTGVFFGRSYRVIGRTVLGETECAGTYYWNEFNLESSSGKYATLVFEETGSGGPWKFFEMFEPTMPMDAKEAATKREPDSVNLDGTPLRVTLVQRSEVYFVEGKVPEGVRVGQHAHYFNAEDEEKMEVVSWTGEEVEFFTGRTIGAGEVAAGFRMGGLSRFLFLLTGGRNFWSRRVLLATMVPAFLLFLIVLVFPASSGTKRAASAVKLTGVAPIVFAGESGELNGRHYEIATHAVVEVAEVGLGFSRHEYELNDDDGHTSLLISRVGRDAGNWLLAEAIEPETPLTPERAGAMTNAQLLAMGTESARVDALFRSAIAAADGVKPKYLTGGVYYGFSAAMASNELIVRWNSTNIFWFKGRVIPEREVKAAFSRATAK